MAGSSAPAQQDPRPAADADAAAASTSKGHEADRQRKAHVLKRHVASLVRSISDAIVIKDGEPFFLCPPDGQIPTAEGHGFGLYHHDTRYLAGYELRIAGATPNPLAATALTGGRALFELTLPALALDDGSTLPKERLTVRWDRDLDGAGEKLRDRLTIRNFDRHDATLPVHFAFAADFNDIFAIRSLVTERAGTLHDPEWQGDVLVFRYDGKDGVDRGLRVSFDHPLRARDDASCAMDVTVPGRGVAAVEISLEIIERIRPGSSPIERRTRPPAEQRKTRQRKDRRTTSTEWSGGGEWPLAVRSDSLSLNASLSRSLDDLLTLRGELDGQRYYSAGLPWFGTLFGRDALISAYQTLAFDPTIAAETLRLLAGRQGDRVDDYRDEQPGRILHELRVGELARLGKIPQTPYYGSIDATPLFLVVLARHARWAGTLDLFTELRDHVDRALAWLDGDADPTGSGFVAYDSTSDGGLANQGWKDSGDAIVTADGRIATPPIALAEVQGYAYAARREIADLFEAAGDADRASALRSAAEALRERFEAAFWSDELGAYVLALEADGRQCSVLASNTGQVLWSGIASPERAKAIAGRLLGDEMFPGWGIRTLSSKATAFNPIGYHLGTVWPHDNGLIAEGFRRYHRDEEAERLFIAMVEASADFPQRRLPECFAGYDRSEFGVPVRYPVACHPQAWAAGTVPHLLTSTLGLDPDGFAHRLDVANPRLPRFVEHLELRGLPVGGATVDLTFDRTPDGTTTSVDRVEGDLDVKIRTST